MNSMTAIKTLTTILENEASALRRGDLAALSELKEQKETAWAAAVQALKGQVDIMELSKLRVVAHRNAHLLIAARKGLSDGGHKARQARMPRKALTTYGADGAKSTLGRREKQSDGFA